MKRILLLVIALVSFGVQAQNVNIPDVNFKNYLVGNASINTNADTEIQVSEAIAFAGIIDCNGLGISDLTGIETFANLGELHCHNNSLSSLDVTQNTALTELRCHVNQIATLDVTQNIALTALRCHANQIVILDVSQNTDLTILSCYENQLASLDVSLNTTLINLRCYSNLIMSLDVSNNVNLTNLECGNNSISSLDLSSNTALTFFGCGNNTLASLDLSNNVFLTDIYCYENLLSSLNIANGTNGIISVFWTYSNPNLTCIQVDDAAYSTANWTDIDAGASFSTNCGVGIDEETNNISFSIYPNPASDQITIDSEEMIEGITIFNMFGELVQRVTSATFSVENLSNGVYVMNIQTANGVVRSRFIKE
jgi:hypothetical protein